MRQKPSRTRELRWVGPADVPGLALVNADFRALLVGTPSGRISREGCLAMSCRLKVIKADNGRSGGRYA